MLDEVTREVEGVEQTVNVGSIPVADGTGPRQGQRLGHRRHGDR